MMNKLNKFFLRIHSLDGLIHWLVQRSTAITAFFCLSLFIIFDNLTLAVMIGSLFVFHISAGIQTLIDDYIHDDILFLISVTFLRITVLFLSKTLFIIFVC